MTSEDRDEIYFPCRLGWWYVMREGKKDWDSGNREGTSRGSVKIMYLGWIFISHAYGMKGEK